MVMAADPELLVTGSTHRGPFGKIDRVFTLFWFHGGGLGAGSV